jgi:hypothetical protein
MHFNCILRTLNVPVLTVTPCTPCCSVRITSLRASAEVQQMTGVVFEPFTAVRSAHMGPQISHRHDQGVRKHSRESLRLRRRLHRALQCCCRAGQERAGSRGQDKCHDAVICARKLCGRVRGCNQ